MENLLLNQTQLPSFSHILPAQIEPALKHIIAENRVKLADLLKQSLPFTWDNLIAPLEEMHDALAKFWSPVAHIHAVAQTEELRKVYHQCLPLLTEYHTELGQNETLYQAIKSIEASDEFLQLTPVQRKVILNELRDFELAGVALSNENKVRFAELQKQLSTLTTHFEENLLDATQGWTLHVTDLNSLSGLPEQTLALLQQNAEQTGVTGWLITLDSPTYSSVMKFLDNRELRWLLYEAYVTRASDQGPCAGRWDNTPLIEEILKVRHEMANLLGFASFADYSLATKMAAQPSVVIEFLQDLTTRATQFGMLEIEALREFAKTIEIVELETWDISYCAEKLRQTKFALQQEEIRAFFPVSKVLDGMFQVVNRLYGITIVERIGVDTWCPQVQFFDIMDAENNLLGSFYTDLYARPHKREGAWMDDCRIRRRLADGSIQQPVAFLTCNFSRPVGNKPVLLTHDEVITLFHEFGHCLHHLLTKVEWGAVSGINGVPWDAVELPSQFMEHWCWEKETLALISAHCETGAVLPDSLYHKMLAAKHFQAGMFILRQLEFALFDFRLHAEYDPQLSSRHQAILDEIRQTISPYKTPHFNRFQHGFTHIFSGGYAAGYYSYLWAEVLSCDAYAKFEETGIFNPQTGQEFLKSILERGGTESPMDLFIEFRGRKPTLDALLKHNGLYI